MISKRQQREAQAEFDATCAASDGDVDKALALADGVLDKSMENRQ